MNSFHLPEVNARYWAAITLASVFGTNLGDLYAHESHLGLVQGLSILCVMAALAFVAERTDKSPHEAYYWLVIIVIRTGATNIADYLAFKARVPMVALIGGLVALLCALAWRSKAAAPASAPTGNPGATLVPGSDASYWGAMLVAGVFGTVVGDVCSHLVGQGVASLALGLVLCGVLLWRQNTGKAGIGLYWLTVATARTAGTAIGDWLAENKSVGLGLPLSTVLTGCVFVAVLMLWNTLGKGPLGQRGTA
jgi:uncharacterized membrane-anchored protein